MSSTNPGSGFSFPSNDGLEATSLAVELVLTLSMIFMSITGFCFSRRSREEATVRARREALKEGSEKVDVDWAMHFFVTYSHNTASFHQILSNEVAEPNSAGLRLERVKFIMFCEQLRPLLAMVGAADGDLGLTGPLDPLLYKLRLTLGFWADFWDGELVDDSWKDFMVEKVVEWPSLQAALPRVGLAGRMQYGNRTVGATSSTKGGTSYKSTTEESTTNSSWYVEKPKTTFKKGDRVEVDAFEQGNYVAGTIDEVGDKVYGIAYDVKVEHPGNSWGDGYEEDVPESRIRKEPSVVSDTV
jgi:hypothetical protein